MNDSKAPNKPGVQPTRGKPFANPYLAGVLLGLVLFASFFLTGGGLGASGGMNRVTVWCQDILAPEHVDRNPYLLKMAGGEQNPLDHGLVFLLIGALIGGAASGLLHGRWRLETNRGPRVSVGQRWLLAFIGGAIMGYGARFARGCTSGQALSGGATLAAGSWLLMFAIFGGAYALAWFLRKTWN